MLYLILTAALLSSESNGAFELLGEDAASLGMAGAGCARMETRFVPGSNPAGLCSLKEIFAEAYHRRLYNLNELRQSQVRLGAGLAGAGFQLDFFDFGGELYRENAVSVSAGKTVWKNLAAGAEFKFYNLYIKGNGSAGAAGVGAGILWRLYPGFSVGAAGANFNRPVIGACREKLPVSLRAGIAYSPADILELCADFFREKPFPDETRLGVEFRGIEHLTLRAGISDQPMRFSAGFDIYVKHFSLIYAFCNHHRLGLTQLFGARFYLK